MTQPSLGCGFLHFVWGENTLSTWRFQHLITYKDKYKTKHCYTVITVIFLAIHFLILSYQKMFCTYLNEAQISNLMCLHLNIVLWLVLIITRLGRLSCQETKMNQCFYSQPVQCCLIAENHLLLLVSRSSFTLFMSLFSWTKRHGRRWKIQKYGPI